MNAPIADITEPSKPKNRPADSPTPEPVSFCSGFGQYHSVNHPTNPKKYLPSGLADIVAMVRNPPCVPKSEAKWAIFSTTLSRIHAVQLTSGQFGGAWLDIDENPNTFQHVVDTVKSLLPGVKFLAYLTKSATLDNQKCRIIFPYEGLCPGQDHVLIEKILNDLIENAGIKPDRKTQAAGQICYLPNCGQKYAFHVETGQALDWRAKFSKELATEKDRIKADEIAIDARREESQRKYATRLATGTMSPMDAFNATHSLEDYLEYCGYKKFGNRYLSPNSSSGSPGVSVKDGKWISSHESDRETVGQFGDAWDLYVFHEHQGDLKAALKAAGDQYTTPGGETLNKANQRAYMEQQERVKNGTHYTAEALGKPKPGGGFIAPCPGRDDKNPSLSIDTQPDGKNVAFEQAQTQPLRPYSRFGFKTAAELTREITPTDWLIHGILEGETLAVLFADPGSYKSFLAISFGLSIATGTPWYGRSVKKGFVVFIIGEGSNGFAKRLKAWSIGSGVGLEDAQMVVSTAPAQLLDEGYARHVRACIEAKKDRFGDPVLIVIDTLARNFGGDENSTEDMTKFISNLDQYLGNHCTRLIVHHSGHGDKNRGRGSSALKGAVDVELMLERNSDDGVTLTCQKMKDAPPFKEMSFDAHVVQILTTDPKLPDTSLYLVECKILKRKKENLSMQMRQALGLLEFMTRKVCPTCLQDWMHLCISEGIYARSPFYNATQKLEDRNYIKITGDYVSLSSCPMPVLPVS